MKNNQNLTRRSFLKTATMGTIGTFVVPVIVPSSVFGANAPSNLIHVGAIGCSRISRDHDMPCIIKADDEANAMLSRAQRYPYNIN
jgi:hypothetical protein